MYNFADLADEFSVKTYEEVLIHLFLAYGKNMALYLNGNYSMVVVDKICNEVFLFTNHTGYKPLYYYECDGVIFYSTDINWLVLTMRSNKEPINLDYDGAICLVSHGYMLGDLTLINKVKKVLPGFCIQYTNGNVLCHQYFNYSNIEEVDGSYEALLDKAERLFSQAVLRIYKKDDEYGYKHLCTLSGGLDSRSVAFSAKALGYKNFFITMSQAGELEEIVATEIAKDLKEKHLVYHLDNSDFMMDVADCIISSGGTITYPGFAHIYSMLRSLNLEEYGAIITGEIGDLVFGGGKNYLMHRRADLDVGAFSSTIRASQFLSKETRQKILDRCNNAYEFFLLNRGLNSACNGWFASYYFTESASPFVDVDFMKFILSVPNHYRLDSKFYIDWMNKYHPDMCKYTWTGTRTKPNASKAVKKLARMKRGILHKVFGVNYMYAMNPYGKWITENRDFAELVENSLQKADEVFRNHNPFHSIVLEIRNNGKISDKLMITTLMESIKAFSIEI